MSENTNVKPVCSDFSVTGPCGHVTPFDDAWIARDHFICPACFLAWHVEQDPPFVTDSGFALPGERRVVSRGNLPESVGRQAMATRRFQEECGLY